MREKNIPQSLVSNIKEIGFIGKSIDMRCEDAINTVKSLTENLINLEYDPNNLTVRIDDNYISVDDFTDFFLEHFFNKTIIIESTSLGFVEILLVISAMKSLDYSKEIHITYWEPLTYNSNRNDLNLLHKRDFELSEQVIGFKGIPGFTPLFLGDPEENKKVVFCLGFEVSRLERALEELQMINPKTSNLIFGVPAFQPGWEMNSFANHINMMEEWKIHGGISFSGATNPLAIYNYLSKLKLTTNDDEIILVPLGTKPAGLGVILFLVDHPEDVKVLYDHPVKENKRTNYIASKHFYEISL